LPRNWLWCTDFGDFSLEIFKNMTRQIPGAMEKPFMDELLAVLHEEGFHDPFLNAVRSGRMSRAGAKAWTLQAALVVREFTRFISAIHANCPYRDGQQLLAENLWEEHGGGFAEGDHYALIRRMARSLGASDEEIDATVPLAATTDYINFCLQISRDRSFIESMTAIGVGLERYMPVFFGALGEAFQTQYGLKRKDVNYLLVHVGADEDHARRAIEIIETYARSAEIRELAKQALRDMLRIKHRFAEALYAFCSQAG
jgi:pyrroloquinoline quinone (PQQ) biosynthesis protein C